MDNPAQPFVPTTQPTSPSTESTPVSDTKPPKKFPIIFILLGVIVLALVGGAYYLGVHQTRSSSVAQNSAQPTPTVSQPTPTSDPTTAWSVYTSQKNHFEFKFPPTWNVEEKNGTTLIVDSKNNLISMFYPDDVKSSIYTENYCNNSQRYLAEKSTINISGLPATKCILKYAIEKSLIGENIKGKTSSVSVTVKHQENIFILLLVDFENEPIFDQILSTFKFTDQAVDTLNQNTYTNTQYGFTFQYPTSWFKDSCCSNSMVDMNDHAVITLKDGKAPIEGGFEVSVGVYDNNSNMSTDTFIEKVIYKDNTDINGKSLLDDDKEYITSRETNGNTYTFFDGIATIVGNTGPAALFMHKNYAVFIITSTGTDGPLEKKYLDQILSTFKFTD